MKIDESKSMGAVREDIMVDSVPAVTPSSVPDTTPTEVANESIPNKKKGKKTYREAL